MKTQFCFKTIVDHRNEVWGITLMRFDTFLVTASSDTSLRVYSIKENNKYQQMSSLDLIDGSTRPLSCYYSGLIQRMGKGRTINLVSDPTGTVLGCSGSNTMVELFYFYDEVKAIKRLSKRLKKPPKISNLDSVYIRDISLIDKIKRLPTVTADEKINSFDIILGSKTEVRVAMALANNSIKLFSIDFTTKNTETKLLRLIQSYGHHTQLRSVVFNSDSLTIASSSNDQIKFWSRNNNQICLKTMNVDHALSLCFVPGDRHLLVGLKSGILLIMDVLIGEITESIKAHDKELWSICLISDQTGCVTGSNDQTIKFWSFELIENSNTPNKKLLSLIHKSTLVLDEPVLCLKLSKDNKFIAVALLDNTVKIFFVDTYKLYLSLYGHSLPVLCLDISSDSLLIVTGSVDRNIKIWGMDFGDCHRSIFAHEDSVMAIQFIPKTHMFFTCGKDGEIKQWDADNYQKILSLSGHIGEAYGLAVSPNGRFLISIGSDKALRLFERTNELLVLQDIQEVEREEIENQKLATGDHSYVTILPSLKLPSKKTVNAEKGVESILECLKLSSTFDTQENKNDIPALMVAYDVKNSYDFLVQVLSHIRTSDLEESLVLLPLTSVCEILKKMPHLIVTRSDQIELLCRVLAFVFKIHQKIMLNNQTLMNTISDMHRCFENEIKNIRDLFGYNFYALQLLRTEMENNDRVDIFKDVLKKNKSKKSTNEIFFRKTSLSSD